MNAWGKAQMLRRGLRPEPGLLIIAIIALLPLSWLPPGRLALGGEFDFPLYPIDALKSHGSVWSEFGPMGVSSALGAAPMVYHSLLSGAFLAGLAPETTQRILFCSLFAAFGFSAWYFMRTLFPSSTGLARGAAALFYMMNPFTMVFTWHHFYLNAHFHAACPALIASFIQYIRTGTAGYAAAFLLIGTLASGGFANPTSAILLWAFVAIFVFVVYFSEGRARGLLRRAVSLVLLWCAVNAWWIVPFLSTMGDMYAGGQLREVGATDAQFAITASSRASFDRLFGLWGYWVPMLWEDRFDHAVLKAVGLLPALLALAALASQRNPRERAAHAALAITLAVALFAAKGAHPPFGHWYPWVIAQVPFAGAFRNPMEKIAIGIALAMAPLYGLGLERAFAATRLVSRRAAAALVVGGLVLIHGVSVWPMWTGDVMPQDGDIVLPRVISVPKPYHDARRWLLNESGDMRLFSLPTPSIHGLALTWQAGRYRGVDPKQWVFPQPTIATFGHPLVRRTLDAVLRQEGDFDELLGTLNVGYVVIHDDYDRSSLMIRGFDDYIRGLTRDGRLPVARTFGDLTFLKVPETQFLPRVWAAGGIIVDGAERDQVVDLLLHDDAPRSVFIKIQTDAGIRSPSPKVQVLSSNAKPVSIDQGDAMHLVR